MDTKITLTLTEQEVRCLSTVLSNSLRALPNYMRKSETVQIKSNILESLDSALIHNGLLKRINEMFSFYVMGCLDPREFYHMSNDQWLEILPQIEETYQHAERFFPFSKDDAETIRTVVDCLLEEKFGKDVLEMAK